MSQTTDLLVRIERLEQENYQLRAENNALRPLHASQQAEIARLRRDLEKKELIPTDFFHG